MSFEVPQRNQALMIRRARAGDAGAIAQVHVQSWREFIGASCRTAIWPR